MCDFLLFAMSDQVHLCRRFVASNVGSLFSDSWIDRISTSGINYEGYIEVCKDHTECRSWQYGISKTFIEVCPHCPLHHLKPI